MCHSKEIDKLQDNQPEPQRFLHALLGKKGTSKKGTSMILCFSLKVFISRSEKVDVYDFMLFSESFYFSQENFNVCE